MSETKLTRADLVIAPNAPASAIPGVCGICSITDGVRFYQPGYRCPEHKPAPRTDFYGIQIPMTERHYDPDRLERLGQAKPPFTVQYAPDDSPIAAICNRRPCDNLRIPVLRASDIPLVWEGHYRTRHSDTGWIVGPRGGSEERLCGPCGGESPGGFARVDGKEVELPPKGQQFGATFSSSRHDLCLDGTKRGRYVIHCDCQHRTGDQVQPHLKNR